MTIQPLSIPFHRERATSLASRWIALPGSHHALTAGLAMACLLLPTASLVAVLRWGFGALVICPVPREGFLFLGKLAPEVLAQGALEDLLFFGLLQQGLLRRHAWQVVVVPLAFAATHVAVLGHAWGLPIWLCGGFLMSFLTRCTAGSLWPAFLIHVSANLGIEAFRLLLALNFPAFP